VVAVVTAAVVAAVAAAFPRSLTSTASLMAMPSEPGELGSFSRMARPDAVSGDGEGCRVAPLPGQANRCTRWPPNKYVRARSAGLRGVVCVVVYHTTPVRSYVVQTSGVTHQHCIMVFL